MTKVIFRKDKKTGTIEAFFPNTRNCKDILNCYTHVDQYGIANRNYYLNNTVPATIDEAQPLYNELVNKVGYNLEVVKHLTAYKPKQAYNILISDCVIATVNHINI